MTEVQTMDVYTSCQMTDNIYKELQNLLDQYYREDNPNMNIQISSSAPFFNFRYQDDGDKKAWEDVKARFNIPAFGYKIPMVLHEIFANPAMDTLREKLGVPSIDFTMNSFVMKKSVKVDLLVKLLNDKDYGDVAERLNNFLTLYRKQTNSTIQSIPQWERFLKVDCGFPEDWKDNLHFDKVMTLFGMTPEQSKPLQEMEYTEEGWDKSTTYEQYSYGWLVKAICGYNFNGCIADMVNLVFSLMQNLVDVKDKSEENIVRTLTQFNQLLQEKNLENLVIPAVLVHDFEYDDMFSWLLLEYLHQLRGTELITLGQFPSDVSHDMSQFVKKYSELSNRILFDPKSRNLDALMKTHNLS